jgi:hypothetical protein
MTAVNTDRSGVTPALLDRLVDGELGEADRRALLVALDRELDGWKRCALAFLEAQAWQEAARHESARRAAPDTLALASGPWRLRLRQIVAVAAAVAVAFCVGFASRGAGDSATNRVVAQQVSTIDRPVAPSGAPIVPAAAAADALASVPEYVRQQMERQGYRVQGDRRMVPVALGDGRRVAMPVETVSLKYVGQRIH